jgi:hypothetical protein
MLRGSQRSADSGGSCSDDYYIVEIFLSGFDTRAAQALSDYIHAIAALVDGVLDEGEAAKFSDDKQTIDAGLVFSVDDWNVGSGAGLGHDHGDRADRALFSAEAVANTFVSIDDVGFAVHHSQHVDFRTDDDASTAADAGVGVDSRMLRLWAVRKMRSTLAGFRACASLRLCPRQ